MKLKSLLFIGLTAAMIFAGCKKDEELATPSISIDPTTLNIKEGGATETIVLSSSRDWTVEIPETAKGWVTVSPSSGSAAESQTIEIKVESNEGQPERSATLTFKASLASAVLEISQDGEKMASITVAEFLKKEVNPDVWYQLTGTIKNISNTSYGNFDLVDETGSVYVYGLTKTKVEKNDQSFSELGLKEGDIVTLMGTRDAYEEKDGTIKDEVGGPAYYISHKAGQGGSDEPDTPEGAVYFNDFDKGTAAKTEDKWPDLAENLDLWNGHTGSGAANVTYTSAGAELRNTFSSNVTDASGKNNVFFNSVGDSHYLQIEKIALPEAGADYTLSFLSTKSKGQFSTDEFKVSVSGDGSSWTPVTYDVPEGLGTKWGLFSATFTAPAGAQNLYIKFEVTVGSVYRLDDVALLPADEVEEPQPETPSLAVSTQTLSVPATSGTTTFDITANVDWTVVSSDATNFSVSDAAGNGNKKITVNYTANETTEPRNATITVATTDEEVATKSFEIKVTQAAKAGEPEPSVVTIDVESLDANLAELSNGSYGEYKDAPVNGTIDGIGFSAQNIMANQKNNTVSGIAAHQLIQMKEKTGFISNTTAKEIKSLKVYMVDKDSDPDDIEKDMAMLGVWLGTSENPTTPATVTHTLETIDLETDLNLRLYVCTVTITDSPTYFKVTSEDGAIWISKIEVEF